VPVASADAIVATATITEALRAGVFRATLEDSGHNVLVHLAGRMRRNRIRVLVGDRVQVELSAYDPAKGRITYRWK
jgi:translation initiation factor IF-1